jgi:hypothetical protein
LIFETYFLILEADIAARQLAWQNLKRSDKLAGGDNDVVVLSSDDEENELKPSDGKVSFPSLTLKRLKWIYFVAKRWKEEEPADSDGDSDCVCLGSDAEEDGADASASCSAPEDANGKNYLIIGFSIFIILIFSC